MTARGTMLITGGEGRLAATMAPELGRLGWEVIAPGRAALDVTDASAVSDCLRAVAPDVVLNLAAWTDVEACEREPERCENINARGVVNVRRQCELLGAHLVHVSSDHVFDGEADRPYTELDPARPVNVYGVTKLHSEAAAGPTATVLRTSWISGRRGRSLVASALTAVGDPASAPRYVNDQFGSPTVADDLVGVVDRVSLERVAGCFHVAGRGVATPHAIASLVFEECGLNPDRVVPVSRIDRVTGTARRPVYAVLDSSALARTGIPVPGDWRESVARLVAALRSDGATDRQR